MMWKLVCAILFGLLVQCAGSHPRTLYIGDSHSYGTFGRQFDSLLRASDSDKTAFFASSGSAPSDWDPKRNEIYYTTGGYFEHVLDHATTFVPVGATATPKLDGLFSEYSPDRVIIQLGTNMIDLSNDEVYEQTLRLGKFVTSSMKKCIWLGPPDSRRYSARLAELVLNIEKGARAAGCTFIDSRKFTKYPENGGDGIHFDSLGDEGVQAGKNWAAAIFAIIAG